MMRAATCWLLAALACPLVQAQSFVSMGRLFTTPSERAQLDQRRNTSPPPAADAPAPPPGMPPAMPAEQAPAAPAQAAPISEPVAPPPLQLDGIIRRSHGPATLIVNGELRPASGVPNAQHGVRLQADGRSVVLKPGQWLDPATGEVYEASR